MNKDHRAFKAFLVLPVQWVLQVNLVEMVWTEHQVEEDLQETPAFVVQLEPLDPLVVTAQEGYRDSLAALVRQEGWDLLDPLETPGLLVHRACRAFLEKKEK